MLEDIKNLLILQDRDRKILRVKEELAHIPYERRDLESRNKGSIEALDQAKHKVKQLESDRKDLELEVTAKKELIDKYSVQQFQTKKNEEYRALAKEIETCKRDIRSIEDRELEIMEKSEAAEKEVAAANQVAQETKKNTDERIKALSEREANLKKELEDLEKDREELSQKVEDTIRSRYERLLKSKGNSVVVGIQNGVCGGCHMTLSRQIMVSTQMQQEMVCCTNCGRILYYTPDMNLATAE